jgi:hypothetical protein
MCTAWIGYGVAVSLPETSARVISTLDIDSIKEPATLNQKGILTNALPYF